MPLASRTSDAQRSKLRSCSNYFAPTSLHTPNLASLRMYTKHSFGFWDSWICYQKMLGIKWKKRLKCLKTLWKPLSMCVSLILRGTKLLPPYEKQWGGIGQKEGSPKRLWQTICSLLTARRRMSLLGHLEYGAWVIFYFGNAIRTLISWLWIHSGRIMVCWGCSGHYWSGRTHIDATIHPSVWEVARTRLDWGRNRFSLSALFSALSLFFLILCLPVPYVMVKY